MYNTTAYFKSTAVLQHVTYKVTALLHYNMHNEHKYKSRLSQQSCHLCNCILTYSYVNLSSL